MLMNWGGPEELNEKNEKLWPIPDFSNICQSNISLTRDSVPTYWYRWQIQHSIGNLPRKLHQLLWRQISLWFDIRIFEVSVI